MRLNFCLSVIRARPVNSFLIYVKDRLFINIFILIGWVFYVKNGVFKANIPFYYIINVYKCKLVYIFYIFD